MRFCILRTDFDLKFKFYSGYLLKFVGLNLSEFKNRARNLTLFYELFLKMRRKNEQIRFIGLAQILNLMRVLSRKFYSFRRVLKRRKSL